MQLSSVTGCQVRSHHPPRVVSSQVQKSFLVCFPPSVPSAPSWLSWAWRKIPGTANISVNTFISMRIYIQFLCQNTVRKYSILPCLYIGEKINKYSQHWHKNIQSNLVQKFPSISVISAFRNWHFSTSCKFLVQQNVNISPPTYP